jgi:hypothetical protein
MRIEDLKKGDIVDVYKEGQSTKRVMIFGFSKTGYAVGITSDEEYFEIFPEREVEKVIANINDLQ